MLEVDRPADMRAYIGKVVGISEWLLVNQATINAFAEATGDHQWIHVDVERAKKEMPGGKTIAHGYLTLSLLPRLSAGVYRIRRTSRGINYGSNKVRFTAPVPSGSRVRLHQVLKSVEDIAGGVRMTFDSTVELEGSDKPALIAEALVLAYKARDDTARGGKRGDTVEYARLGEAATPQHRRVFSASDYPRPLKQA
jgi:acyl dehydratase